MYMFVDKERGGGREAHAQSMHKQHTHAHVHLRNVLIMYKRECLIKEGIKANVLSNHGNSAKRK